MAGSLGSAVLDLTVNRSAFSSGLAGAKGEAEATMSSLGSKAKSAGLALMTTLTPLAAALGIAFQKAFNEWDTGIDAIRVGTGATGKELDKLGESMKRVGSQVTQPLSEVGKVMAELQQRTGATGKPLEQMTKQILDLARITGGDAQASVAGITRMFGDWSIATEDQSGTLDKLFRISQVTGIGVQELSEYMVAFGSPLRNLGLDFDTSAAMFARFEKEGVNIQTVMPGLKMALKNFAAAGREPAEALKETFSAMENAKSESKLMSIAFETFGARAGPDLAAAVREGRFDFDKLIDTMNNGKDTIQKATADTNDLSDKMAMWKNTIVGVIGPFGQVGSVISGALAAAGPAIYGFGMVADTNFGKVIAGWVKSAAAATASAATQVAKWLWLGVQSLLHAAKVAAAWLIAMGPIAIVVAAVIGLAVLIVKNWDKIKEFLAKAWNWIKQTAQTIWNAIKALFVAWFTFHLTIAQKAWDGIKSFLSTIWNGIKNLASTIWNGIKQLFVTLFNAHMTVAKAAWNGIKDFLSTLWNGIKSLVGTVWGAIKTAFQNQLNGIKNVFTTVWNAIKEVASNAWERLKVIVFNGITKIIETVKELPGKIKDALGNLGSLLLDAGRAIIQGLIDGIVSMLSKLWSTVSGIARKIKDLKGPLSYDYRLLMPAGSLMMKGLKDSITAGFALDVAPAVAGITAELGATSVPVAAGAGGSSTENYNFYGDLSFPNIRDASQADQLLKNLKQIVRQGA